MPYFPVPITGMQYEMSPNRDMIHLMLNQLFSGGAIVYSPLVIGGAVLLPSYVSG
jgi:hypothetical protein